MTFPHQVFELRDQREPGWYYIDNEVLDQYGLELGPYGVAVYNVLCRRAKNNIVHLAQRDIAQTLGMSQDRVRKSLADLVRLGLIYVEVPERPGPGVISTTTLLRVKRTERHTFSSTPELNATRSCNKEEKNKTKQYPPNPPAGGLNSRDRRNIAKELERIYQASVGVYQDADFEERVVKTVSARLVLPLDEVRTAIARSYGEIPSQGPCESTPDLNTV